MSKTYLVKSAVKQDVVPFVSQINVAQTQPKEIQMKSTKFNEVARLTNQIIAAGIATIYFYVNDSEGKPVSVAHAKSGVEIPVPMTLAQTHEFIESQETPENYNVVPFQSEVVDGDIEEVVELQSKQLQSALAFSVSQAVGYAATRILKLANPPKGFNPVDVPQIKMEIKDALGRVIWGFNHLKDQMRPVEDSLVDWCNGGYSRPVKNDELDQIAKFMHMTKEQALVAAEASRTQQNANLVIKRKGKLEPMLNLITNKLKDASIPEVPPTDETFERIANSVLARSFFYGDFAECALIQADAIDWLGKSLAAPKPDEATLLKANAIKGQLLNQQAEQAQRDAEKLNQFDLDLDDDVAQAA